MTRQIKFRVWDKIDKCMAPLEELHRDWIAIPVNDGDGGHLEQRKMDDVVLMQWTRLLDKNGKEIYEGDIVKITSLSISRNRKRLYKGRAKIKVIEWHFSNAFVGYRIGKPKLKRSEYEIIGNIYENPNLLN